MCEIADHLRRRLAAFPEGVAWTPTRENLRELLDRLGCHEEAGANRHVTLTQLVYSPEQLAPVYGVSARTVTRWVKAGRFGDPTTLRQDGRLRIPAYRVRADLEGWTSQQSCAPELEASGNQDRQKMKDERPRAREENGGSSPSGDSDRESAGTLPSRAPRPPRPRGQRVDLGNGWPSRAGKEKASSSAA